jgi:hypothetical protein
MKATDPTWLNTIAEKIDSSDMSIVACVVCMVFFMKFNQHEGRNKANRFIGWCLGAGFLILIIFRILKWFL